MAYMIARNPIAFFAFARRAIPIMNHVKSLTLLVNARERAVPWYKVATALNELELDSAVDGQGRPWLALAAEQTGYAAHQLRVMTRTLKMVEDLARDTRTTIETPLSWPLSSLEILGRIARIDPTLAAELLRNGVSKFVNLRKAYNRVRDRTNSPSATRSAGHRSGRAFRLDVIKAATNPETLRVIVGSRPMDEILGLRAWPGGMQFADPDAVIVTRSTRGRGLIALECARIIGDLHQEQSEKVILKAAVEATFFDQYFLCLPNWSESGPLVSMRNILGLANVGILMFSEGKASLILPTDGPPVPDRRSMILESISMRKRFGIES